MTEFGLFLVQVVLISLSGVLGPGPITAATISAGAKNKWAGGMIAVGHGVVELPLVVVILFGLGTVLAYEGVQVGIGIVGGVFLVLMGRGLFVQGRGDVTQPNVNYGGGRNLWAGVMLSASNPYFLLWWATIGVTLATTASSYGVLGFAVFAVVHWICDLIWLLFLSWMSYKGTDVFGSKLERVVLFLCSAVMFGFGVMFLYKALAKLVSFA